MPEHIHILWYLPSLHGCPFGLSVWKLSPRGNYQRSVSCLWFLMHTGSDRKRHLSQAAWSTDDADYLVHTAF